MPRKRWKRDFGKARPKYRLILEKMQEGYYEKVLDLNETVCGLLDMLRPLIGEHIELVWKPHAGLWPVHIDPAQVDQIFTKRQ